MPLHELIRPTPDCTVALWKIEESETMLRSSLTLTKAEQVEFVGITHPHQRVEWLACRIATARLVEQSGCFYQGMYKDGFGKPHLIGMDAHISISHTSGWAVSVLHPIQPVGVDVEPFRPQLVKVVPRVLSDEENEHAAGSPDRLVVYWCAKEAIYKRYGRRYITFREHIHIEPFTDRNSQLIGHVRLPSDVQEVAIYCFWTGPGLVAVAF